MLLIIDITFVTFLFQISITIMSRNVSLYDSPSKFFKYNSFLSFYLLRYFMAAYKSIIHILFTRVRFFRKGGLI